VCDDPERPVGAPVAGSTLSQNGPTIERTRARRMVRGTDILAGVSRGRHAVGETGTPPASVFDAGIDRSPTEVMIEPAPSANSPCAPVPE